MSGRGSPVVETVESDKERALNSITPEEEVTPGEEVTPELNSQSGSMPSHVTQLRANMQDGSNGRVQHSAEEIQAALDRQLLEMWEAENKEPTCNDNDDDSNGGTDSLLTALENLTVSSDPNPCVAPSVPGGKAHWSAPLPKPQPITVLHIVIGTPPCGYSDTFLATCKSFGEERCYGVVDCTLARMSNSTHDSYLVTLAQENQLCRNPDNGHVLQVFPLGISNMEDKHGQSTYQILRTCPHPYLCGEI